MISTSNWFCRHGDLAAQAPLFIWASRKYLICVKGRNSAPGNASLGSERASGQINTGLLSQPLFGSISMNDEWAGLMSSWLPFHEQGLSVCLSLQFANAKIKMAHEQQINNASRAHICRKAATGRIFIHSSCRAAAPLLRNVHATCKVDIAELMRVHLFT